MTTKKIENSSLNRFSISSYASFQSKYFFSFFAATPGLQDQGGGEGRGLRGGKGGTGGKYVVSSFSFPLLHTVLCIPAFHIHLQGVDPSLPPSPSLPPAPSLKKGIPVGIETVPGNTKPIPIHLRSRRLKSVARSDSQMILGRKESWCQGGGGGEGRIPWNFDLQSYLHSRPPPNPPK